LGKHWKRVIIVGVHVRTINLDPNASLNQYLDFYINKYIPAYEKVLPGVKLYVIKGLRGDNVNSLGVMWVIKSAEIREKYWPEPDGTASEITLEALKKIVPIRDELRKLGRVAQSTYTDWEVL